MSIHGKGLVPDLRPREAERADKLEAMLRDFHHECGLRDVPERFLDSYTDWINFHRVRSL